MLLNGANDSQMAFWTCYQDRNSKEHAHDFDEYFVVVHGQYTVIIDGKEKPIGVRRSGMPHSEERTTFRKSYHRNVNNTLFWW